jgi:putative ABC transport system substrate-binding protein
MARRREILRGLLGAVTVAGLGAACGPPPRSAQPDAPRRRKVGYLAPRNARCVLPEEWRVTDGAAVRTVSTPLPSGCAPRVLEELGKRGYRDGDNVEWIYASPAQTAEDGGNDVAAFGPPAAALVAIPVEVIITAGGSAAFAAKEATTTIPIVVSSVADVVETGLVPSLAHPGGNITGVSVQGVEVTSKRLEILKEAFPSVRRPILVHGPQPTHVRTVGLVAEAAGRMGLSVVPVQHSGTQPDFLAKATRALDDGADSLAVVGGVPVRATVASLIRERRLPAVVPSNWIDDAAAAISLEHVDDDYATIPDYVDRILRGAHPADLPITLRSSWELVVNAKAAADLGLTVAPSVIERATRVIR